MFSKSNSKNMLAGIVLPDLLSQHPHSRQATLSQAQMCTKVQVSSCFVTHFSLNTVQSMRYNNRSPRKLGRIRHAVAERPKTLTPSTNPRLAAKACTRNFIDVPYNGFLGPSWELPEPTRILHHLINNYFLRFNKPFAKSMKNSLPETPESASFAIFVYSLESSSARFSPKSET